MKGREYRFTLDVHKQGIQYTLSALKNETGSTKAIISLCENANPYLLQDDNITVVTVSALKPDGKKVLNDCAIIGNCVVVEITAQMLAAVGAVICELELSSADADGTLHVIATPRFKIDVGENLQDSLDIVSTDEYQTLHRELLAIGDLEKLRDDMQGSATAAANSAAKSANSATESADCAALAEQYKNAAKQSADTAGIYKSTAVQSATNAYDSAAAASQYKDMASQSARAAANSATTAGEYKDAAAQSAAAAANSAQAAENAKLACLALGTTELTGTELDVTASPQLENGFYKAAQNMKLVRAQGETENFYIPKDTVFSVFVYYDSEIGGDYTNFEIRLLNDCLLPEYNEVPAFRNGYNYFYASTIMGSELSYTVVSKMATDYNLKAAMQEIQSQIGLKTAALPDQSSAPSAGSKAYLITACDQTAKTFTLDGVYGLAVGDVYSITASGYANVEDVGKITAINGKVVTVDHLPVENGVGYGNAVPKSDALPENFPQGLAAPYFRIIAKPTVGSQSIGTAALAGGISTEAQMDASFVTGRGSKSLGKYGVAMGDKNTAYYASAAIGGVSNKAFGKNSTIIGGGSNKANGYSDFIAGGQRNETKGNFAFATGSWNKVLGFNAAAFGLYNESHGQNDFVTGYKNIVNGYCAAAFGLYHSIKGKGNFATGQGNNAAKDAENCFITGQSNLAKNAASCILAGSSNTVSSESETNIIRQGVMLGAGNKVTGSYGVALGYNNIAGTQAFAAGVYNTANGWLRFAIGERLTVSNDRQVVVGTYNKSQNAAFIVGNGTSDTARSNAFVVNKDGSAEVGKQGTKDSSVVTLGTLEERTAKLGGALTGLSRGAVLCLNDISPVEHQIELTAGSKNLLNLTLAKNAQFFTVTEKTENKICATAPNAENNQPVLNLFNAKLPAGTYTLSCSISLENVPDAVDNVSADRRNEILVFKDGTFITKTGAITADGTYFKQLSFTLPAEATVRVGWYRNVCDIKPDDSLYKVTLSNVQLEFGETATAYTPYLASLAGVRVTRHGKNLFNPGTAELTDAQKTANGVTFTAASGSVDVKLPAGTYSISFKRNKNGVLYLRNGKTESGYFSQIGAAETLATFNYTADADGYLRISSFTKELALTDLQIERASAATAYEPFTEKVYTADQNGSFTGVTSLYPVTTLLPSSTGVSLTAKYNKDINKAFAALQQAIISLGGNF